MVGGGFQSQTPDRNFVPLKSEFKRRSRQGKPFIITVGCPVEVQFMYVARKSLIQKKRGRMNIQNRNSIFTGRRSGNCVN